ncbi:hypothetical protein FS842_000888 [Serendipita sp. 407]|nr:hypothetical protein FS842_000888 [Serendipita sp. 407]
MDEKQTPSPKTESMTVSIRPLSFTSLPAGSQMVNAPSRKQNVACDACRYVVVQSVVDDQRTMCPFSTGVFQSLPFAGAVVFGSENERFLPKAGGLKVENQVSQGEMSSSSRSSKVSGMFLKPLLQPPRGPYEASAVWA